MDTDISASEPTIGISTAATGGLLLGTLLQTSTSNFIFFTTSPFKVLSGWSFVLAALFWSVAFIAPFLATSSRFQTSRIFQSLFFRSLVCGLLAFCVAALIVSLAFAAWHRRFLDLPHLGDFALLDGVFPLLPLSFAVGAFSYARVRTHAHHPKA